MYHCRETGEPHNGYLPGEGTKVISAGGAADIYKVGDQSNYTQPDRPES